jgi:hypothetical protein
MDTFQITPDVSHGVTSIRWSYVEAYRGRIEESSGETLEQMDAGGSTAYDWLFRVVHRIDHGGGWDDHEGAAEWIERVAVDEDEA